MHDPLMDNALSWLLEPDEANPGVRFFALRDLMGRGSDDPDVRAAQAAVMQSGPVPAILAVQQSDGSWPGASDGYYPKYRGTVWSVTFLAQFGADGNDTRVRAACAYVLEHIRTKAPYGGFAYNGTPSGFIHCLEGNLTAAMIDSGWLGDAGLGEAIDWLARSVTGDGVAPADDKHAPARYYRSGNSGPGFACAANEHQPCAWGAVKVMLALGKIPPAQRTAAVDKAIAAGVDFLLSRDPAVADYPIPSYATKPNGSWFQFGYPIGYVTDALQNLEVLTALNCGTDSRLHNAVDLVLSKRDKDGRWAMTYTYNGKIWADIEQKGKPSKWVTLRALRMLRSID